MELHERSWAAAMRAERQGNRAAYEAMLGEMASHLRPRLRRRLARLGLDADMAEDVLQEVLMGIHQKRHTWEADRPLTPWLAGIVRYKLLDATRRLRREAGRRFEPEAADWYEAIEAPLVDPDIALVDLERPLAALPPRDRQVVRALAIEGASVRSTAAQLALSDGAVRLIFSRAIDRIRGRAASLFKEKSS